MINNQTYIQNLKITDVPWHRLTTPYGRATDFPGYLAVLEKADDIKAAEKALNELAGNIEHQSTLWQASPFGMVFLTRIFTQALAAGETNPVARYIAAELFDFFTLMANVCEEIEEFEPEVVDTLDIPSGYLQAVKEGMRMVNTYSGNGTAYNSFNSFPIAVCGKTGTADFGSEENYTVIGRRPYGNYISFAPMDNPQIAIFSTLYDGNKGSEGASIHLAIYEAFFKELLETNYSAYTKSSGSYQKYVANGLDDNKENAEESSNTQSAGENNNPEESNATENEQ